MLPLLPIFVLHNSAFALSILQEEVYSDFNDLGKVLLGGFVLAIAVAIALTFVKLRLRDKKPPAAEFISISPFQKDK